MIKKITLAEGAGGQLMDQLIKQTVVKSFKNQGTAEVSLTSLDDAAVIDDIVFSTDSYTIQPLIFPGGDIGRLSICGTVNDIAVMGGKPIALSCGMLIEEGFEIETLERIVRSMDIALEEAGAHLVTGDTKVMERGSLDGVVINTAGIGLATSIVRDSGLRIGDCIIVNGSLGDHEMAVLSQREGFRFQGELRSDCAPLNDLVGKMLDICPTIRCMRDPTRGGWRQPLMRLHRCPTWEW
jgi:hydrogenase expression/formation protein HypE